MWSVHGAPIFGKQQPQTGKWMSSIGQSSSPFLQGWIPVDASSLLQKIAIPDAASGYTGNFLAGFRAKQP